MTILVTGGAGYIGSHTCVELLGAAVDVVVVDNFCNSRRSVPDRIRRVTGKTFALYEGDVRDGVLLDRIFTEHPVSAVIHFAGLKAVGESVVDPLAYFDNNFAGSLGLARAMARHGVKSLVFSSSATVYGDPHSVPIREEFPLVPTNPYGRSKLMVEDMLRDLAASDAQWRIGLLRYFNPVGAHASGILGEDPNGIPNNLMPYISRVAAGALKELSVFGSDYPTPDGTGVRDYIHVMDLAAGHLAALRFLEQQPGMLTVNLGTGRGYSVLEMVRAFEKMSKRHIPHRIGARRPGDVPACYADPSKAAALLGWRACRDIESMCADTWRWQHWISNQPE
ncbi:MAG: UDP-glucose 4-epimerase GalE [Betaproteobacteria bacterium]